MWKFTLVLCYSLAAWTIVCVHGQSCPAGHVVGSTCYRPRSTPASWSDAENDCQRMGGHLAAADSSVKQATLQLLMAADSLGDVWLGGHLENAQNDKGIWKWVTDDSALAGQGCYEDRPGARDLPYEQGSLTGVLPATCMAACDSQGYAYAGVQDGKRCFCGNSYGIYQLRSDCITRCEADRTYKCGGTESNFVYKIGGTFGQWAYAQPNDFRGFQHCATISKFVEFKLGDEQCYKEYGYICDVPYDKCNGGGSSGQSGYLLLNTSCVYVTTALTTWFTARTKCQQRGGDLLKIGSAVLQDAIKTKFASAPNSRTFWVGLSRRGWYWTSGQPFTYFNWKAESPNGDGGNCLRATETDQYRWSNAKCSSARAYYCLTDFVETTTTTTTTTTALPTTTTTTTTPAPTTTKHFIETTTTTTTTTTTPSTTTTTTTTPVPTTTTTKHVVETTTTATTTTKQQTTTTSATKTMLTTTTKPPPTTTATTTATITTTKPPTTSSAAATTTTRAIAVPTKSYTITTKPEPVTSTSTPLPTTTMKALPVTTVGSAKNGSAGGPNSGSVPAPSTGKSSSTVGGLSTVELVLIVICLILLLLIILMIIVLCYYKSQARNGSVYPEKHDDFRHVASVPFSTPYVIDDGYATNSDFGSNARLVTHKSRKGHSRDQYHTKAKIMVQDNDLYY